ncbi:BspA family leucine-rich repeat surface protein [Acetilactobacillus jinshanensis]|uniref:BspA family leucine-rich repeat surface protein n=1 Tax=Acetilactobacillus jinshanensis TaxID=1720083 RepID=A0A4P6ZKZ1_9LACO|nr:BspA family leucine-rich repeat surface protein [Acetilactobacillus jinshanensis]QBP18485.1 BspA family leucine-rich repeat surface protein [Acetilactobacillus jinshanensis]
MEAYHALPYTGKITFKVQGSDGMSDTTLGSEQFRNLKGNVTENADQIKSNLSQQTKNALNGYTLPSSGVSFNSDYVFSANQSDNQTVYVTSPVTTVHFNDIYGNSDGVDTPSGISTPLPSDQHLTGVIGKSKDVNISNNNWQIVDGQGHPVTTSISEAIQTKPHTVNLDVAPVWDGMTYDYNKNNNSIVFTSTPYGTISDNNSDGFLSHDMNTPFPVSLLKSIEFKSDVSFNGVSDLSFNNFSDLQTVKFDNVKDASDIKTMSGMFYSDPSLQSVEFNGLNTTGLTDMHQMFYNDPSLNSVNFDLNTKNVTNMQNVFYEPNGTTWQSNDLHMLNAIKFGPNFSTAEANTTDFFSSDHAGYIKVGITNPSVTDLRGANHQYNPGKTFYNVISDKMAPTSYTDPRTHITHTWKTYKDFYTTTNPWVSKDQQLVQVDYPGSSYTPNMYWFTNQSNPKSTLSETINYKQGNTLITSKTFKYAGTSDFNYSVPYLNMLLQFVKPNAYVRNTKPVTGKFTVNGQTDVQIGVNPTTPAGKGDIAVYFVVPVSVSQPTASDAKSSDGKYIKSSDGKYYKIVSNGMLYGADKSDNPNTPSGTSFDINYATRTISGEQSSTTSN